MNTPIEKVLKSLLDIRASMQDTANTSVTEQLDSSIQIIQKVIESEEDDEVKSKKVLSALSKVFERLPSIASLIKLFCD